MEQPVAKPLEQPMEQSLGGRLEKRLERRLGQQQWVLALALLALSIGYFWLSTEVPETLSEYAWQSCVCVREVHARLEYRWTRADFESARARYMFLPNAPLLLSIR